MQLTIVNQRKSLLSHVISTSRCTSQISLTTKKIVYWLSFLMSLKNTFAQIKNRIFCKALSKVVKLRLISSSSLQQIHWPSWKTVTQIPIKRSESRLLITRFLVDQSPSTSVPITTNIIERISSLMSRPSLQDSTLIRLNISTTLSWKTNVTFIWINCPIWANLVRFTMVKTAHSMR